jgi:hypothetical protein
MDKSRSKQRVSGDVPSSSNSEEQRALPKKLDLGLTNLMQQLQGITGNELNLEDSQPTLPSVSKRALSYLALLKTHEFINLECLLEQSKSEFGENDLLSRTFAVQSRLEQAKGASESFPRGTLGMMLHRVLISLPNVTQTEDDKSALITLHEVVPRVLSELIKAPELAQSIGDMWAVYLERHPEARSLIISSEEKISGVYSGEAHEIPTQEKTEQNEVSTLPSAAQIKPSFFINVFGKRGRQKKTSNKTSSFITTLKRSAISSAILLLLPAVMYALWAGPSMVGYELFGLFFGFSSVKSFDKTLPWHQIDVDRPWTNIAQSETLKLPTFTRLAGLRGLESLSFDLNQNEVENEVKVENENVAQETVFPLEVSPTIAQEIIAENNHDTNVKITALAAGETDGKKEKINTQSPIEPYRMEPEIDEQVSGTTYTGTFPRDRYFVTRGVARESGRSGNGVGSYYEIQTPTFVFSSPSFSSERLLALAVGDQVLSQEVIGRWLRVVSHRGDVGFVPLAETKRVLDK